MGARISTWCACSAAILLAANTAAAQGPYSMTGKLAHGQGPTVRLPATGTPCDEVTARNAFGINQTQKYRQPSSVFSTVVANTGGCLAGSATSVSTTGSGGFGLPARFFYQAPMLNVVPVPFVNAAPQFHSSFMFSAPYGASAPWSTHRHRKAATPKFAPGPWNQFRADAHLATGASSYGSFMKPVAGSADGTATPSMGSTAATNRAYFNQYVSGRTSANFTACAQPVSMGSSVPCTFATQGTIPGVLKNIAGPRVFGGTLGILLTVGPNTTPNVAVTVAGGYSSSGRMNTMATRGSIVFNALMGQMSRQPGKGYAAYDTVVLSAATIFTSHMLTTIYTSRPWNSRVIGGVGAGGIMLPAGTNRDHGFPWTTGTQIVRGTGKTLNGGPGDGTFSLMGFDSRMTPSGATGMGGTGTIQLVAGALSQALPLQAFSGSYQYSLMRLEFAPEPGAAVGGLAGAAGLLCLVAWRRRAR